MCKELITAVQVIKLFACTLTLTFVLFNNHSDHLLSSGCEMALLFPMRSRRIYVTVVPDAPLSLSSFTVCMWVKLTATSNKTVLFSYGSRQNPYEIQLLLAQTSLLFTVGGEAHLVEAQGVAAPGQWSHLCGEWSSDQGQAKLWADGKKVASTSGVAEGHILPDGGLVQLGQERSNCCGGGFPGFEEGCNPKLAFVGKMTGVNMWDRGLTGEEISQLAQRGGQGCQQRGNMVAWGISEMVDAMKSCRILSHDINAAVGKKKSFKK
uniref:Pentraxin 3, long b n=1 Tax=Oryzias sinensis TaxID=183150 RepID=A0A8C7X6S4_9TELE